jgi:hypothetical protein
MSNKFGPFAIGARETARREWRSRVDAAARAWARTPMCRDYAQTTTTVREVSSRPVRRRRALLDGFMVSPADAPDNLRAALSAPRPWRSAEVPPARVRYSRAHRRACWKCDLVKADMNIAAWVRRHSYLPLPRYTSEAMTLLRRDPHGARS